MILDKVQLLIFFFNDTATTEIYTLSLHDALPISRPGGDSRIPGAPHHPPAHGRGGRDGRDRGSGHRSQRGGHLGRRPWQIGSTRLNSSHANISYAVFCLKKKKYK